MTSMISFGELTIRRIVEQEAPFFDPLTFFPTLTPELLAENRAWLEPAALDPASGKIVLCIQSYILRTPHHTILIDSCVGNDKPRPTRPFWHQMKSETYMRSLAAAGISVNDIDLVMCTHLHVDHVGWNTRLDNGRWVPTFPRARYVFSGKELDYWRTVSKDEAPWIEDSVLPIVAANRAMLVTSDHALDDQVRLLPTPGHTPDHFAVCVGGANAAAVMCGDLIHSPLQARYPEISMRADYDPAQAAATRRRFLEEYADTDTLVCTAHFPSPSVGRFTRWGEGFRFVPHA
jgi:glyoxylase-like metal-dependent hydrolase (beta-lactamase superfamily II)